MPEPKSLDGRPSAQLVGYYIKLLMDPYTIMSPGNTGLQPSTVAPRATRMARLGELFLRRGATARTVPAGDSTGQQVGRIFEFDPTRMTQHDHQGGMRVLGTHCIVGPRLNQIEWTHSRSAPKSLSDEELLAPLDQEWSTGTRTAAHGSIPNFVTETRS